MPAGRVATHVKQSHDPNRRLSSHVVQSRTKATSQLQARLGRQPEKTKAQLAEELRQAVENTRGQ